ncbi:unnamed protein product [Polarella glacialis]|uniref:Alcohol dehydrogenase-like C-terminal domain-containing protein n=1 Tax=Polarella glacialis TaxID=89957 RepID=A0A813DPC6_POLGL|nr:unnamed protein product [Polarella glacialis]
MPLPPPPPPPPPHVLSLFQIPAGSTGRTAYYGVFRVLQPKRGEIMFVSGAAGATGAVAGQLGKIAGCRVLGSAGSAEKVQALLDLGFDGAFNYREEDASKALDRLAPEGIDLFFENTGGPVSEAVVSRLRDGARIAVSGLIDWYHDFGDLARMLPKLARAMLPSSLGAALHSLSNPLEVPRAAALKFFTHVSLPLAQMRIGHCDPALVQNQAPRFAGVSFSAENFLVTCFDVDGGRERAEAELGTYVREGRVKHLETLLQGSIEDVPRAFIHMLGGGNKGKQIVELVDQ